jgi:hypothetical protein
MCRRAIQHNIRYKREAFDLCRNLRARYAVVVQLGDDSVDTVCLYVLKIRPATTTRRN